MVPSLYLKPFSRYLHLNTECSQTDGQKEKSITIYLAVHSVHLADITSVLNLGQERRKVRRPRDGEIVALIVNRPFLCHYSLLVTVGRKLGLGHETPMAETEMRRGYINGGRTENARPANAAPNYRTGKRAGKAMYRKPNGISINQAINQKHFNVA